jgi:hypothetical protein
VTGRVKYSQIYKMNLPLVAFFGPKPEPLRRLVEFLQSALYSELGPAFSPYAMEQVHATIIGLEGRRFGAETFNLNTVQALDEAFPMDLPGLFQFMLELPPFRIRIGGFTAGDGTYPFSSRGLHPYIRSFMLKDSLAVMIGWPVAGKSYPMTLDALCRECRRYNVLDKYHQKVDEIDNDFFLVLGRVDRNAVSSGKVEYVQDILRQLLARQAPLDVLVRPVRLSVVSYNDAQLPILSSTRYSLDNAFDHVEELKRLYDERVDLWKV